jgi:hypothetical protein
VEAIAGGHRVTITDVLGTKTLDVMDGEDGKNGSDGEDGKNGRDGKDGVSPTLGITSITGGNRVTITDAQGTKSFDVMDGKDGKDGTGGSGSAGDVSGQIETYLAQNAQDIAPLTINLGGTVYTYNGSTAVTITIEDGDSKAY